MAWSKVTSSGFGWKRWNCFGSLRSEFFKTTDFEQWGSSQVPKAATRSDPSDVSDWCLRESATLRLWLTKDVSKLSGFARINNRYNIQYLGQFFSPSAAHEWDERFTGSGGKFWEGARNAIRTCGAGSGSGYYHAHFVSFATCMTGMTQDALDVGWLLYHSRLSELFLQGMCRSRVLMMPHTESVQTLDFRFKRIYNSTTKDEKRGEFQCREDLLVNSKGCDAAIESWK